MVKCSVFGNNAFRSHYCFLIPTVLLTIYAERCVNSIVHIVAHCIFNDSLIMLLCKTANLSRSLILMPTNGVHISPFSNHTGFGIFPKC